MSNPRTCKLFVCVSLFEGVNRVIFLYLFNSYQKHVLILSLTLHNKPDTKDSPRSWFHSAFFYAKICTKQIFFLTFVYKIFSPLIIVDQNKQQKKM